jgi:enoyl-CoA hydratase/carnithine racemase
VGAGVAARLLLTGDLIDAPEALRIGLANRVVPGSDVVAESVALVRAMLANGPLALARIVEGLQVPADVAAFEAEATAFAALFGTADFAEGTAAFLAKRAPAFAGR